MSRSIHCAKLGVDAEGLDFAPWPGALGQRIYAEISKPAWQQWLNHQTMLINEYRLNPLEPKSRQFLGDEMEKFLFGSEEEAKKPEGYRAPDKES
jgi:Fe-S cluster biosynthesis and repair protein YggX